MRFTTRTFKTGTLLASILILSIAPFALIGCTRTITKVQDRFVNVPVPVATGCIAPTGRPDRPTPLKERTPPDQWAKLAPGAKAEAVKAQAGERMNYEDADRAATSGCK